MLTEIEKWLQTIKVSLGQLMAYRINFFLQVLGPSLVFFFIKYNLWHSIYQGDQQILIGGFTLSQMISYHVWALVVGLVASGHASMNLSEDIRLGRISSYLIYPFNFWEFHSASFLAFQLIQFVTAIIVVFLAILFNLITLPSLGLVLEGVFFTFLVSVYWFMLQFLTGVLSFWLEETWILRVMLTIMTSFLSGAIIPLELFPAFWAKVLDYTPFPYLAYYPIKIFQGEVVALEKGLMVIGGWMILALLGNLALWRKGLRLYTAAGM